MRLFAAILLFGQVIMAATFETLQVGAISVPLIFEQDSRLPIASMQVVFRNSGHVEDGNISGLSRLSAQILNEGTKAMGLTAFAEALEQKAIHLSVHTGTETMVAELSCLKEQFDEGVGMLGTLLADPNTTDETLEKIKAMTIGALKRKESDFDTVASNELRRLQFPATPLEFPPEGTVDSVASVTLDDVKSFLSKHLVQERLIFVIGGDMTLDAAKSAARDILGVLPHGTSDAVQTIPVSAKVSQSVLKRPTEQAYIYFGSPYHMAVDDAENYKARVATYILGAGGFGSRLMEEIRVKRGLAYSAYARLSINRSHSVFKGYLQTKNESLEEAQKTVTEVISDFVSKGVTQSELDQAKKFLMGSEPLRVETLSQRLSRTFMDYYKGLEPGASEKELEQIHSLTLDELNGFIKAHDEILQLSFAIVTE